MDSENVMDRRPPWWQIVLIGRHPRRTLIRMLVLAVVCVLGYKHVVLHVQVSGFSMQPALADGRKIWINRLAYLLRAPRRGDIVAIQGKNEMLLKRVIGLPGERLAIEDNQVLINGQPLDEPYLSLINERRPWNIPERQIGAHECYVIGDNRSMDQEGHYFGRTDLKAVLGKVWR